MNMSDGINTTIGPYTQDTECIFINQFTSGMIFFPKPSYGFIFSENSEKISSY